MNFLSRSDSSKSHWNRPMWEGNVLLQKSMQLTAHAYLITQDGNPSEPLWLKLQNFIAFLFLDQTSQDCRFRIPLKSYKIKVIPHNHNETTSFLEMIPFSPDEPQFTLQVPHQFVTIIFQNATKSEYRKTLDFPSLPLLPPLAESNSPPPPTQNVPTQSPARPILAKSNTSSPRKISGDFVHRDASCPAALNFFPPQKKPINTPPICSSPSSLEVESIPFRSSPILIGDDYEDMDDLIDKCILQEEEKEGWKASKKELAANRSGSPSINERQISARVLSIARANSDNNPIPVHEDEKTRIERLKNRWVNKGDPNLTYTIQDVIGVGSVGEVMCGIDEKGEKVAIKKLQTKRRGKDRLGFILREIEIIATSQHQNIVKYFDSYFVEEELWVVMEFMSAGSLFDLVKLRGDGLKFPPWILSYVIHEVLNAVAFLHGIKRIHRDIKVDNVLISFDGGVKLADFGTAVQLTFSRVRRTTLIGTPYYMAPEIIEKLPYNEKVDVWSLGICVIEMVEGEPPFFELDPNQALEKVLSDPVFLDAKPDVPSGCLDFVNSCCLLRNPSERWTAQALLQHYWLLDRANKAEFSKWLMESPLYKPEPLESKTPRSASAGSKAIPGSKKPKQQYNIGCSVQ